MATQPLICLFERAAIIVIKVFDGCATVLSSAVTISATSDSTPTSSPASEASCSIQPTAATGGSVSRNRGTQREPNTVVPPVMASTATRACEALTIRYSVGGIPLRRNSAADATAFKSLSNSIQIRAKDDSFNLLHLLEIYRCLPTEAHHELSISKFRLVLTRKTPNQPPPGSSLSGGATSSQRNLHGSGTG